MAKNLRHEMRDVIMSNFSEHIDKHALKRDKGTDNVVTSYAQRNALLDVTNVFCKWVKVAHPEVKHIEDVTKDVVADFGISRLSSGVTQHTLDTYRADLKKIGKLANQDWSTERIKAQVSRRENRGANDVISKADYNKILKYCEENPSGSALAIRLERELGVRVSDMAYGIRLVNGSNFIQIRSKGGKILEREITPNLREIMRSNEFQSRMNDRGGIDLPKDSSINRFLNRVEDTLGIERHSFHSLRRFSAQEHYDECRNNGMTQREALRDTSVWLNHGEGREQMMIQSYIKNVW